MAVETYECQETITEPLEASEEAIGLIESCGLEGQKSLISKAESSVKQKERCPYRVMKEEERTVYELLCPRKTNLEEYADCPIPLRVLQIIAHAQSLKIFQLFQVWSADAEVKDPILVAYKSTDTWRSDNKPFILARWADELEEWSVLVKKACQKRREQIREALAAIKAEVERDIAALLSIETVGLDIASKDLPKYYKPSRK